MNNRRILLLKCAIFVASLVPTGRLIWNLLEGNLGANPVETITHVTGDWAFNFLLITLAVTPLRAMTGLNWLVRFRRMLGLFSFFYALLHFLAFAGFDHLFDIGEIMADVVKRPFVTVGFAAFVLLIPLSITSFNAAIRWMGGRRWQKLHRAIYVVGILSCLHYFWLVKITAIQWPIIYAVILVVLLGWRIRDHLRKAKMPVVRSGKMGQPKVKETNGQACIGVNIS